MQKYIKIVVIFFTGCLFCGHWYVNPIPSTDCMLKSSEEHIPSLSIKRSRNRRGFLIYIKSLFIRNIFQKLTSEMSVLISVMDTKKYVSVSRFFLTRGLR